MLIDIIINIIIIIIIEYMFSCSAILDTKMKEQTQGQLWAWQYSVWGGATGITICSSNFAVLG